MLKIEQEAIIIVIELNESTKIATVWCSHADIENQEAQNELKEYITECKEKKILVCVFNSGNEDLFENTKDLLSYNFNNTIKK